MDGSTNLLLLMWETWTVCQHQASTPALGQISEWELGVSLVLTQLPLRRKLKKKLLRVRGIGKKKKKEKQ